MQTFYECTGLTVAPDLPSSSLTNACYVQMFYGCSSLQYIKAMFLTEPSSSYVGSWVSGVASDGTFVGNCDAEWDPDDYRGVNGIPNGWSLDCDSPDDGGEVIK